MTVGGHQAWLWCQIQSLHAKGHYMTVAVFTVLVSLGSVGFIERPGLGEFIDIETRFTSRPEDEIF